MKTLTTTFAKILVLSFALSTGAFAAPKAIELRHSLTLSDYQGQTLLDAMLDEENGIKAHFDEDYIDTYEFADWESVETALQNFDKKIVRRVLGAFGDDKRELRKFVEKMAGEEFTPETIAELLEGEIEDGSNLKALEHFFGIASGAGTLVRLDEENYYYNIGYKSGEDRDDVRSGRSYGATTLHNANDASDVMYLNELEAFLKSEGRDTRNFYETFLEILTKSDVSGMNEPSFDKKAEAAMTDLVAIYTAELNRHIMVDLHPSKHPWENDLAEATFMSIFSARTGLVMKEGVLEAAPLRDYWAMSPLGNGRSGIGITRGDRRKMQVLVANFERDRNPALVKAVEKLIGGGGPRGDIFRGVMEFLNDEENQEAVRANADAITKAVVDLLMQVEADAEDIAAFVEHQG